MTVSILQNGKWVPLTDAGTVEVGTSRIAYNTKGLIKLTRSQRTYIYRIGEEREAAAEVFASEIRLKPGIEVHIESVSGDKETLTLRMES